MKQGEEEETKSKGKAQDKSKASKTSKCISAKKKNREDESERIDEHQMMSKLAEVRTGRGSVGPVQGGAEMSDERDSQERER